MKVTLVLIAFTWNETSVAETRLLLIVIQLL